MSSRAGFRDLIEDVYKRERNREEDLVLEIEKKNLAIARYGESTRKICSEFCKEVGYELRVHEHRQNRPGMRWENVKEVHLTAHLGPKGHCVIIVEFRGDHIRIYPNTDARFDEIRLAFAEFSEEKLAEKLKTAYKQLRGKGEPERVRAA
jgi:hypothetical protein